MSGHGEKLPLIGDGTGIQGKIGSRNNLLLTLLLLMQH